MCRPVVTFRVKRNLEQVPFYCAKNNADKLRTHSFFDACCRSKGLPMVSVGRYLGICLIAKSNGVSRNVCCLSSEKHTIINKRRLG